MRWCDWWGVGCGAQATKAGVGDAEQTSEQVEG